MMKANKLKILVEFIETLPSGSNTTYEDIEKATGLPMNKKNKTILYKALHKCQRSWLVEYGIGIALDGANNAMSLMKVNLGRMDNSIHKTHRVCNKVMEYTDQLKKEEVAVIVRIGSMLGAILATRVFFEAYPAKPMALNTISSPRLPHL